MTWPWPTLPMLPSWNILQPSTISKLVQINSLFLPLSKWNSTTTSFCMTSCSELICKLNNLHGTETTLNFPMQKYLRPEIPKRVRDVVNEGPKCGMVGFWSLSCTFWQKIYQTKVEEGTLNIVGGSVVKLYLFFSCSDSRPHMLLYFCAFLLLGVFTMLCTLFQYLNSTVSDYKHELRKVALLLHISIYKSRPPFLTPNLHLEVLQFQREFITQTLKCMF